MTQLLAWLESAASPDQVRDFFRVFAAFMEAQGESIPVPSGRLTREDIDAGVIAQGEASAKAEFLAALKAAVTTALGRGLLL